MLRQSDPRKLARLAEVHLAIKAREEDALTRTRAAEIAACESEKVALEDMRIAQENWLDCHAQSGFAPDYSRALASRLIVRDATAERAGGEHREAIEAHRQQEDIWRMAEARMRSTKDRLRAAQRDAARRREEKRLDALSDRITHDWSRS
ncbi:hypothetical protein G4G27_02075 [Sphingomonas sp. So64.6b]|uniref:hypothetical protein n=1 Tax=Sphingomonas sp. So64.6b TaxID=2997354 RepID=UPI0015FF79CD|nr:hypothetical protein [Sphingomonas sp. So64.6b]QNA82932.1 hypothetical protein G4G27_02075 [Sphingomonas sp. So64.6b]